MTKEDKQIIDRAVKENWQIGDRTRLKRLLKKNLELCRENIGLEVKIEVLECDNYNANCNLNLITDQLTKAKEILKMIVNYYPCYNKTITEQAEQFLKEIEK